MNAKEEKIIRLNEVGSTNDYAKARRGEGVPFTVVARRQTGGRGTKGRSFSSEEGGAYLSKLSFYESFPAKDAFQIMIGAAVAVCETVKEYGVTPVIKWPNDIFVNGKKICGILIENTFSGQWIASSVVGIGLNVCNCLPEALREIGTTLKEECGKEVCLEEVIEKLLLELSLPRSVEEYRAYLGYVGERISLLIGDKRVPATLLCVDEQGRLCVEIEGEKAVFSAAEVTLR